MHEKDACISTVLNHVAAGLTVRDACRMAGVGRSTFYAWLAADKGLRSRLRKAESSGVAEHLANIRRAAEKDWRASAWWLERRHPAKFANRRQVKVSQSITRSNSCDPEKPTGQIDLATLEQAVGVLRELGFVGN